MYTNLSTSTSMSQEPSGPSVTDFYRYKYWAIISTVFAGTMFLALILYYLAGARLSKDNEVISAALEAAQKRNRDLEKGICAMAKQLRVAPAYVEQFGRDVPQPPRDAPQPQRDEPQPPTNEEIRREQPREPTPRAANKAEAMDDPRPRNISEGEVVSRKGYWETKNKYREAKRLLREPRSRELHPIALSTPGRFCSSPEFKGPNNKVVWPFLGKSGDDSETDMSSRLSSPSVVVSRRRSLC
ncbi:hypothetical protein QQX98_001435 [Neonectria punicea]|uniref:Uncharacterized protein n=1 Tax=Neonectria punicea TaxID=979145 RepID=A0ABR1HNS4_9HYPO